MSVLPPTYEKAASKFLETFGSEAIADVATNKSAPVSVFVGGFGQGEADMQPESTAAPRSLLSVSLITVLPTTIRPGVDRHFSKSLESNV